MQYTAAPLAAPARPRKLQPGNFTLNSTIFLLSAVAFIVVAVMTVTGPLLPVVAEEFAASIGDAGIIVTAFAVPYGACQIFFGPLGDRYGKLRVIALALGASTVFVFACGQVTSLESLAVMRFFCGMCMAATVPLAMAYIADEVPYKQRQPVIAKYINGLVLGQIAGGVLGGMAAQYFDWRSVFVLFAVCSALFALALWRRRGSGAASMPAPATDVGETLRIYVGLFRARRSRDMIITGTLEGMFIFGALAYFGAYLRHEYDLGFAWIGVVLGMYGIGGLIYAAAVYRLVPLLGERGMILGGTFLLGSCYLLVQVVPAWWLTMPVFLLAGFGFYLFHNTMQTKATELSADARGTAVSLWVFMLFVGQGLGVVIFGLTIDHFGYAATFTFAGVGVVLLGAWFQARLLTPAHA